MVHYKNNKEMSDQMSGRMSFVWFIEYGNIFIIHDYYH